MNKLLQSLGGILLILGLYAMVSAQTPSTSGVSYEDALNKAEQISSNIVEQIVSQTDEEARPVAEAVIPTIARQIAEQFADGSFYSHTFDSLKMQIKDHIMAEIDRQFTDPETIKIAYDIAEQIATQMSTQLRADTELDSLQLKLTVDRKRLVYDPDVLVVIEELKKLQVEGENKYVPYTFTGNNFAGEWYGTLKAPAYKSCKAFNSNWSGTWYETDEKTSSNGYGISGNVAVSDNPFGVGPLAIQGIHYIKSVNNANLRFRFFAKENVKRAIFSGNVANNNSVSGTFIAVCPSNPKVGTAGTFTGKKILNDLIGNWRGVSSVEQPKACIANTSWTAQLSELNGNIFGMFTEGDKKYEARGIYDKNTKEALWIAGDHAFLGLIEGGKMNGTMLDADCTPGNARLGTFGANL